MFGHYTSVVTPMSMPSREGRTAGLGIGRCPTLCIRCGIPPQPVDRGGDDGADLPQAGGDVQVGTVDRYGPPVTTLVAPAGNDGTSCPRAAGYGSFGAQGARRTGPMPRGARACGPPRPRATRGTACPHAGAPTRRGTTRRARGARGRHRTSARCGTRRRRARRSRPGRAHDPRAPAPVADAPLVQEPVDEDVDGEGTDAPVGLAVGARQRVHRSTAHAGVVVARRDAQRGLDRWRRRHVVERHRGDEPLGDILRTQAHEKLVDVAHDPTVPDLHGGGRTHYGRGRLPSSPKGSSRSRTACRNPTSWARSTKSRPSWVWRAMPSNSVPSVFGHRLHDQPDLGCRRRGISSPLTHVPLASRGPFGTPTSRRRRDRVVLARVREDDVAHAVRRLGPERVHRQRPSAEPPPSTRMRTPCT
jgi:hypothetical protein